MLSAAQRPSSHALNRAEYVHDYAKYMIVITNFRYVHRCRVQRRDGLRLILDVLAGLFDFPVAQAAGLAIDVHSWI